MVRAYRDHEATPPPIRLFICPREYKTQPPVCFSVREWRHIWLTCTGRGIL